MQGRSRARGAFTWQLTKADLDDRLATDVAAACAAIPPSVRVLTVHGTGARGQAGRRLVAPAGETRYKGAAALAVLAIGCPSRQLTPSPSPKDDADVPVGEASTFAAVIPSHELLVLEGGDHTFSGMAALMELVPAVTAFLSGGGPDAAGSGGGGGGGGGSP
jgi:hypothetical protein